MLRATQRVLKSGARSGFYVITTPGDLSARDRSRLAEREGSEWVESAAPYDALMEEAGYVDVRLVDVTVRYIETLRAWKSAWEAEAGALTALMGEAEFARKIRNRALDVIHAEDGLLRRIQAIGTKP